MINQYNQYNKYLSKHKKICTQIEKLEAKLNKLKDKREEITNMVILISKALDDNQYSHPKYYGSESRNYYKLRG
jgi:cell division septum initiation protein DivIVA